MAMSSRFELSKLDAHKTQVSGFTPRRSLTPIFIHSKTIMLYVKNRDETNPEQNRFSSRTVASQDLAQATPLSVPNTSISVLLFKE